MREQVENRLTHMVSEDEEIDKNEDVMDEIMEELKTEKMYYDS